jgi:hypothetical protein
MQKVSHVTSGLILLIVLPACNGAGGMTPTAPSAPALTAQTSQLTPVPRGPGSGTIEVREVSPSPGSTLTVSDCGGGAAARPCAERWRSTIDVIIDRDMTYAVLVMTFYDGDRLCGLTADVRDVVRAGSRETFTLSSIYLSSGSPTLTSNPCQVPMRTTRMEVELWSDSSTWTNTLKVGLPGTYTFVSP